MDNKLEMSAKSGNINECLQVLDRQNNLGLQQVQNIQQMDEDNAILRCNQTLKLEVAVDILNNTDHYKVINTVPENPKGGDTFLLIPQPGDEEAWKNDGYRWCHYGPKLVPGKNPSVQKRYYAAYMSNGKVSKFHKNVYQLINDDREPVPLLVHYFGDHSVAAMRDAAKQKDSGDNNFMENGTISSEHHYSKLNGSEKKFPLHRAIKPKPIKKCILSKEDFQELHRIAYGLGSYVKLITHYPDLIIVFANKDISDDLENVLKLNSDPKPLFSYSNSYELGDYIVSTFLYTHPAFLERPTIPSHFVIHEKSCGLAHQELCRVLAQMVPTLAGTANPVVLNLDPNKFSAVSSVFPNMHTLFSWKDVIANTKAWLFANGASQTEVTVYIEDLRQLFSCKSKELYEEALVECKARWHDFFEEYYMKEIHEVVNDRLGRWALEKWNVYNPYTGVTDKSNEGLEIVIRQLKVSSFAAAHSTILALCLLQRWLLSEISKSYCGVGPYTIRDGFQTLQNAVEDLNTSINPCPPDQIMFCVQNKRALVSEGVLKDECANSELKLNLQSSASELLKSGAISMNTKQQSFSVKINPVTYYDVKLFPKVSCTCEDMRNGLCTHVLAVKMSLGMNVEDDLRKYHPHRGIKAEMKTNTIKRLKNETCFDTSEQEMQHVQIKRLKEAVSSENVLIPGQELISATESDVDPDQDTEEMDDPQPSGLLQSTLDEEQLNLMQISAASFREPVGLENCI